MGAMEYVINWKLTERKMKRLEWQEINEKIDQRLGGKILIFILAITQGMTGFCWARRC
jgi:hypothetical protein